MAFIRTRNPFDWADPLREMARIRREMDALMAGFAGDAPLGSGVFPALNVVEDGDKLVLTAEIPGVNADELDISIEGTTLAIRGERKLEEARNVSYHRRERKAGCFHKALTLPYEINTDAVAASCKDGVLRLVLPKAEHAKPKKITLRAE